MFGAGQFGREAYRFGFVPIDRDQGDIVVSVTDRLGELLGAARAVESDLETARGVAQALRDRASSS
ncbi:hypothetical protein ABWH91_03180 [Phycisphaerales bacterium ac7]